MPDSLSLLKFHMEMEHFPSLTWLTLHTLDEGKGLLSHAEKDYVRYALGQLEYYGMDEGFEVELILDDEELHSESEEEEQEEVIADMVMGTGEQEGNWKTSEKDK